MRLTLIATALLGLAGCASAPPYERPALPLPSAWLGKAETAAVAPSADWWQAFGDPVLTDLQARAQAANPDLQIALARMLSAAQSIIVADAKRQLQFGIGAEPIDPVNVSSSGSHHNAPIYGIALSARYELDFWGQLAQGVTAAQAAHEASRFDAGTVQISLQRQVASQYFQLRAFDEQIELQRQRIDLARQALPLGQLRLAAGHSTQADLHASDSALDEAEAKLAELGRSRSRVQLALALLLGETPESLSLPAAGLSRSVHQPPLVDALPSALIAQRPDILAAEQKLIAAHADVAAARAALLPHIALVAEAGVVSGPLSRLLSGSHGVAGVGPEISYPLYDGGTRQAEVEASRQARVVAVAEYRKAILAALADVETALLDREAGEAEAARLDRSGKRVQDDETALQARLSAGYASRIELLAARDRVLAQQAEAVENYRARLEAGLSLFAALGGGWIPANLPGTTP